MLTFLIHLLLGILLFLVLNWVGKRTYSIGYIRFTLLDEKDEAHSTNIAVKIFGPIIFLIISAALFQYFKLDFLNQQLINLIYYYIAIRIILILIYERVLIVNWPRIVIYYLIIVVLAKITFEGFIENINSLLPDFAEIKNEIWLLIILFIYQVGNGNTYQENNVLENHTVQVPELKKRKKKYIQRNYIRFKELYDKEINQITNANLEVNIVTYSILIFENFNRPRLLRFLERIWVTISKNSVSQGIMQVKSNKRITDLESVNKGALQLYNKFIQLDIYSQEYYYYTFQKVIKLHNPDKIFIQQVLFISKVIIDNNDFGDTNLEVLKVDIKSEFSLYD